MIRTDLFLCRVRVGVAHMSDRNLSNGIVEWILTFHCVEGLDHALAITIELWSYTGCSKWFARIVVIKSLSGTITCRLRWLKSTYFHIGTCLPSQKPREALIILHDSLCSTDVTLMMLY
jgi:hypothetical protein